MFTPETLAAAIGGEARVEDGVVMVKLLESIDPATNDAVWAWYPFGTALTFIHQEQKYQRLGIKG